MDATSDTTDKPKLEELSLAQLVALLKEAMVRIESLEKKLNCSHSHVRLIIRIEAGQALWVAGRLKAKVVSRGC